MASKSYGIHDKWTNINKINNVDIKSVDGVIESVKINGEEAGGGGGGDFTTANVTITGGGPCVVNIAYVVEEIGSVTTIVAGSRPKTCTAILYKGHATAAIPDENHQITSVSGGATFNDRTVYITGDCAITIS